MSDTEHTLRSVCDAFKAADVAIKGCENKLLGGLPTPSLNEMRYAGYHLVLAIRDNPLKPDQKELSKVLGHTRRAAYDCLALRCYDSLKKIDAFELRFTDFLDVVAKHVGNYAGLREQVETVRLGLDEDTQTHWDDRDGLSAKMTERMHELDKCVSKLHAAEPVIQAEARRMIAEQEQAETDRKATWRKYLITTLLALLGIILASNTTKQKETEPATKLESKSPATARDAEGISER